MFLYTDDAQRRSWLYGIIAVVLFLGNYFGYQYRYGLNSDWNSWLDGIYSVLTIAVLYFGFASIKVKDSSLKLIFTVVFTAMIYIVVTTSYELILAGEFPPRIPINYLLLGTLTAALTALACALIEGTFWSWRDPTKRF